MTVFHFNAQQRKSDREARWHAWEFLSKVGCFVLQYYLGTDFKGFGNATAGLGGEICDLHRFQRHATVDGKREGSIAQPRWRPYHSIGPRPQAPLGQELGGRRHNRC